MFLLWFLYLSTVVSIFGTIYTLYYRKILATRNGLVGDIGDQGEEGDQGESTNLGMENGAYQTILNACEERLKKKKLKLQKINEQNFNFAEEEYDENKTYLQNMYFKDNLMSIVYSQEFKNRSDKESEGYKGIKTSLSVKEELNNRIRYAIKQTRAFYDVKNEKKVNAFKNANPHIGYKEIILAGYQDTEIKNKDGTTMTDKNIINEYGTKYFNNSPFKDNPDNRLNIDKLEDRIFKEEHIKSVLNSKDTPPADEIIANFKTILSKSFDGKLAL